MPKARRLPWRSSGRLLVADKPRCRPFARALAYRDSPGAATAKVETLTLRVLAERLEYGDSQFGNLTVQVTESSIWAKRSVSDPRRWS